MDVHQYEGASEEVECVPVPGAGHRAVGVERFDEQLAEEAAVGGRKGGDLNDVYYPNPARGLDRKAALARVHASPEVLPPKVEEQAPKMMWVNRNAEFFKMRPLPLLAVVAGGFALPWLVRAATGR